VSRFRRPAAAVTLTLSLVGVTVAASACSLTSPKVITTPYAASDGSNADLTVPGSGTVQFRDFLLVSQAKGAPGVLVGAVTTDSVDPLQVQLNVLDATGQNTLAQRTVTVQPGQLTQIGPQGSEQLQVPDVQVPPGSVLTLGVRSAAGTTTFALPVLAPTAPYDSITPTPVPSSASPSESPSPTASASPSASAKATPAATPTGKASASPSTT